MIVRCNNCNSAFAVDDEKVENKKFAFTCPKCSTDNVIDNRGAMDHPAGDQAVIDESPRETAESPQEALINSEKQKALDEAGSEMGSFSDNDIESDALLAETISDLENDPILNESDEMSSAEIADEKSASELPPADDLSTEIPLDDIDDIDFSEIDTVERDISDSAADESDLSDLDLEDSMTDIEIDTANDISFEEISDSLEDIGTEETVIMDELDELPETGKDNLDIDSEMADEILREARIDDENEIVDDFEHAEMDISGEDDIKTEEVFPTEDIDDESITIDLDSLDIELEEGDEDDVIAGEKIDDGLMSDSLDLDELSDETEIEHSLDLDLDSAGTVEGTQPEIEADDDITLDLDSLDIELDEQPIISEGETFDDMDIDIDVGEEALISESDVDDLDFDALEDDIVEISSATDDSTADMDSDLMEIDLGDEPVVVIDEQEELDLDLSPLEIDESIESKTEMPDLQPDDLISAEKSEGDDDITLDLDSLDIALVESDEIHEGEIPEEDEKLTLEDAGLTIEELTADEMSVAVESDDIVDDEDEDIKLTIDDIDPSLNVDNIEEELKEAEMILDNSAGRDNSLELDDDETDSLLIAEFDDLPEIDFEEDKTGAGAAARGSMDRELEDIDVRESKEGYPGGLKEKIPDMVPRGTVNFSVDYSIKYSRVGAFLRFSLLFLLGMIPHFVVFLIYNVLSIILGFINHIVVISTGQNVEDFSEIMEKNIRYFLSINASICGIVEEMPIFTGKDDIDYPLQLNVRYPLHYSRILALLRLSLVGILIIILPHLIILGLLSIIIPFLYLVGIVSVLVTSRWPHILFDILVRYYRYYAKVLAFSTGIVDSYPSFKFD